jgi:hypothetical protein
MRPLAAPLPLRHHAPEGLEMTAGAFTKLAASITESTIWLEKDSRLRLWVCMLAMADQFGRVFGSVPGLAHRARVTDDDTRLALKAFMSPDPDSRTKDCEGRRIEEIDGGWRLLNHAKYRELRSSEDRQEQVRAAQQRRRERLKAEKAKASSNMMTVMTIDDKSSESAQAEAEAEASISSYSSSKTRQQPKAADAAKTPNCPYDKLISAYHEILPELAQVRIPESKRKGLSWTWKWCLTTCKPDGQRRATTTEEGIAWFRSYFERARSNDFLMGRTERNGAHAGWRCDLDYLLTSKGLKQVIEKTEVST